MLGNFFLLDLEQHKMVVITFFCLLTFTLLGKKSGKYKTRMDVISENLNGSHFLNVVTSTIKNEGFKYAILILGIKNYERNQ